MTMASQNRLNFSLLALFSNGAGRNEYSNDLLNCKLSYSYSLGSFTRPGVHIM